MEGSAHQAPHHLSPDHVTDPDPGTLRSAWTATPFLPHPLARNGHAQTVIPHLLPRRLRASLPQERLFQVADGVQVLCLCHWQKEPQRALTLVLVHGLEGSGSSKYIIGTTNKAWAAGLNVVRMNVRTCGGTEALAPTLYHSGMSEDIGEVVRALLAEERLTRIALAGFSMGGNQVLKLAGEWGRDRTTPPEVVAVTAVSPAMDLSSSADALHAWENRLYERHFLKSLRNRLRRKCRLFPGTFQVTRWQWDSIRDFDDCITAPHAGFADAGDYYERASASRVLPFISAPTLILHAKDDPFIRIAPATYAKLDANPAITFIETPRGGHCGFLAAHVLDQDHRWAENVIVEFVKYVSD